MENREWLRSLSDKQLAEEIKYGRTLTDGNSHRKRYKRDLEEAEDEQRQRNAARNQ
jgi:hypothetical protein